MLAVKRQTPLLGILEIQQGSRSWTETELKYFAFVLADEENDFGYKLDTRVDEDCKQNCFRGDKEGS